MLKSIKNAFSYMFQDKSLPMKWFILLLLYLPTAYIAYVDDIQKAKLPFSQIVIFMIAVPIAVAFYSGFLSKCTHNVIKFQNQDESYLPNWYDNFLGYFVIGLKRAVGFLLVMLALLPFVIVGAVFAKFYVVSVPLFILAAVLGIVFSFLVTALDNVFCTNFCVTAYFQWPKAFKIIKSNVGLYISVLLLGFLLGIFSGILYYIKLPAWVFSIVLSTYCSYTALVYAYFTGIISKDYEEKPDEQVEVQESSEG